ncbi:hypothetical protein [Porphyrobacter sp. AAP82]|uniref:hypothetical protein n=1 Tax=Porphyrobacter sp. AAP82 TaxID=1248917 RepID=UPI0002E88AFA|nr:hypothetical protein [Porphyrobacter sp. AAP82]
MNRKAWLALIAGSAVLLLGGRMVLRYLDWQASDAARAPAFSPDIARLQALATAACLCTREKGAAGEAACQREYKAAIAGYTINPVATACEPVSTSLDCIATGAGEACIVTGYGDGICTAEEAKAADSAWTQALEADGAYGTLDEPGRAAALKRADAAFDAIRARIRRGEAFAPASGPGSCS